MTRATIAAAVKTLADLRKPIAIGLVRIPELSFIGWTGYPALKGQ